MSTSTPSHRAEGLEAAAWADLFAAPGVTTRHALGLKVESRDGMTVLRAPGIDHPLFNRVLGLHPQASPVVVRAIVRDFERDGVGRFFVHVGDELEPSLAPWLSDELGLHRFHRAWVDLERGGARLGPSEAPPAREASFAHADEAAGLLLRAFDLPDEAGAPLAALVGRPSWDVVVSLDRDEVVAAGCSFVGDGAYLAMGATRPSHRRRGLQRALVHARVARGLARGATYFASATGEAVPGEAQPSYDNLVRAGFRPSHRRSSWGPAGISWSSRRA